MAGILLEEPADSVSLENAQRFWLFETLHFFLPSLLISSTVDNGTSANTFPNYLQHHCQQRKKKSRESCWVNPRRRVCSLPWQRSSARARNTCALWSMTSVRDESHRTHTQDHMASHRPLEPLCHGASPRRAMEGWGWGWERWRGSPQRARALSDLSMGSDTRHSFLTHFSRNSWAVRRHYASPFPNIAQTFSVFIIWLFQLGFPS